MRGRALGAAWLPESEDRLLHSRSLLLERMAGLLGGLVAEQLVFGQVTTGAASDLRKVAEITHSMVHEYAMAANASGQRALIDPNGSSEISRFSKM